METKAVVMNGARDLEIRSLPVPDDPPAGGAILCVTANGICGSDWDLYDGTLADILPLEFPLIPGHEMVGEIAAIDPEASTAWDVVEGDRVIVESGVRCGKCRDCAAGRSWCDDRFTYSTTPLSLEPGLWGGMSEYMVLRRGTTVLKVADHVDDLDAALFNPFGNSFHWTVGVGNVTAGDRVLVLGPGQRGLGCALAAREQDAAEVIVTGTGRDGHKLALAERFGATHTIDVDQTDTVEAVMEITGGDGVDVVVDTTPVATGPIFDGIKSLRRGGRLVVAGVKGKPIEGFYLESLMSSEITLAGAAATTLRSLEQALEVIESGRYPVAELHTHTVGLDGVDEALKILGGESPGEPIHITILPQGAPDG